MMAVPEGAVTMGRETVALTAAAARGVVEAQRVLRDGCLESLREKMQAEASAEAHAHALEAMIWARMAASHGADDDVIMLASCLAHLANFWGCEREDQAIGNALLSEALAIAERMAAKGHELAGDLLPAFGDWIPPHILQQAKQIKEAVDAAC